MEPWVKEGLNSLIFCSVKLRPRISFLGRFLGVRWGSFPGGTGGKEPAYPVQETKGREFNPLVGKIPLRWARQLTPVFLPGESPWMEDPRRLYGP